MLWSYHHLNVISYETVASHVALQLSKQDSLVDLQRKKKKKKFPMSLLYMGPCKNIIIIKKVSKFADNFRNAAVIWFPGQFIQQ